MILNFEWDEKKADANLIKHHIAFEAAAAAFHDPSRIERYDGREDYGEDRFITIGLVACFQLTVAVAYTLRGDTIRIISARKATSREHQKYWETRRLHP